MRNLLAPVWLPGWMYHPLPWLCLFIAVTGLAYGLTAVSVPLAGYSLAVLVTRWYLAILRLCPLAMLLLLAVPTITPARSILVSVKPVPMEMIVVQSRTGDGPIRITLTPKGAK